MKKTLIAIMMLILTVSLQAESVYERMLIKAYKAGDKEKVLSLIKKGVDVNVIGYWETDENIDMVKFIIKHGYKLQKEGEKREYLAYVIENAKYSNETSALFKLAFENGVKASPYTFNLAGNLRFKKNDTADREYQAYKIFVENSKDIINKGYKYRNTTETPMNQALVIGRPAAIRLLIENGAKINGPTGKNVCCDKNFTPLQGVVYHNFMDLVKLLLEKGVDINEVADGFTALDWAHKNEYDEIELLLLDNGAKYAKYAELN